VIVNAKASLFSLLKWQWKSTLFYIVFSILMYIIHENIFSFKENFPSFPLAVVGGALGIFVSFRTNSGYSRWWESRQLWGKLVNSSRHFSLQIKNYVKSDPVISEKLIYRQILYVHILRCVLREQNPYNDPDVIKYLTDEDKINLSNKNNLNHIILNNQMNEITKLSNENIINHYQLQSIDLTISQILDVQGGCERIKKTPMPPIYGFLASRLILIYSILLPILLIPSIGLLSIPFNLIVCLSFNMINEVGRILENPFTIFFNGIPLTALSKTIEVNLLEVLGKEDIPKIPIPNEKGILM
jgi:putative membrane protein